MQRVVVGSGEALTAGCAPASLGARLGKAITNLNTVAETPVTSYFSEGLSRPSSLTTLFNNGGVVPAARLPVSSTVTAAETVVETSAATGRVSAAVNPEGLTTLGISKPLPAPATSGASSAGAAGKVPNPYGKLGGPAHQGKITELADDLISKGYEVSFEKYVKTTGGFKDARFGDIFVKNPTSGESWIINVGKGTKGGFPISRERKALEDMMNQGYTVQFVPYN